VKWFKAAIGDRVWGITEFGYPSGPNGMPETEAAREIAKEWQFWREQGAAFAVLYQISDSSTDDHDFGLFRADGALKQAIFDTVPVRANVPAENVTTAPQETEMIADAVIYRACFIPLDSMGKPGKFSAYVKPGDTLRVVGVDEHGNVYANPASQVGQSFETFSLSPDGLVALFDETGGSLTRGIRVV